MITNRRTDYCERSHRSTHNLISSFEAAKLLHLQPQMKSKKCAQTKLKSNDRVNDLQIAISNLICEFNLQVQHSSSSSPPPEQLTCLLPRNLRIELF